MRGRVKGYHTPLRRSNVYLLVCPHPGHEYELTWVGLILIYCTVDICRIFFFISQDKQHFFFSTHLCMVVHEEFLQR